MRLTDGDIVLQFSGPTQLRLMSPFTSRTRDTSGESWESGIPTNELVQCRGKVTCECVSIASLYEGCIFFILLFYFIICYLLFYFILFIFYFCVLFIIFIYFFFLFIFLFIFFVYFFCLFFLFIFFVYFFCLFFFLFIIFVYYFCLLYFIF
jgi:hypothetical protein